MRRIGPDGIISTVVGMGTAGCASGYCGEDGPAKAARLTARAVAVGPDGRLYVSDIAKGSVLQVTSPLPELSAGDTVIPSRDGRELYVFTGAGRHLETRDALFGTVRYSFGYDSEGLLETITDLDGHTTAITRNGLGEPTMITGPYGQETLLGLDPEGLLATITDPALHSIELGYYPDTGLLHELTNARGYSSSYEYDWLGRLSRAVRPSEAGGFSTYTRTHVPGGYDLVRTTAMGRTTSYHVSHLADGSQSWTNGFANGSTASALFGADGSTTTSLPNGLTVVSSNAPGPRFGMLAPVESQRVLTTPGGKTRVTQSQRSVVLADPSDPLSILSMTDSSTVNGRVTTTVFDAVARTLVTTSPMGRQSTTRVDTL